jgi:signal transduction histidine kinase
VVVGTAARHGEIEVFVRDSGRGLLPEARQHLFESFFTTKPHGLGLGLAIVRSIVERHRGRVVAENIMSGGAVFRVLLPAVVPESEATLARQA